MLSPSSVCAFLTPPRSPRHNSNCTTMSSPSNSPYLIIDEESVLSKSDHVLNPLSASPSNTEIKIAAPSPEKSGGASVLCIKSSVSKGVIAHILVALFSLLAVATLGAVPNINVQSGTVSAEDLLVSNSCSSETGISGSVDFRAFRFELVIGVLVFLYSAGYLFLATVQSLSAFFLRVTMDSKFNCVVAACDTVFTVLSALAFFVPACALTTPQKMAMNATVVYFSFGTSLVYPAVRSSPYLTHFLSSPHSLVNLDTLYLTVEAAGLCPNLTSPLHLARASVAMMFFCCVAGCFSLLSSAELFLLQKKSDKTAFENCL